MKESPEPPPDLEDPSRRRLLALATGCLGAGLALPALAAACGAVLSPLRDDPSAEQGLVPVAFLDELEPGAARKVPVKGRTRDAYVLSGERRLGNALLVREGDRVRAFSATCPHAGCDVEVSGDGKALACPCHASRFRLDGSVGAGPSPRPLDELDVAVEGGRVCVRWARFWPATPEKRRV